MRLIDADECPCVVCEDTRNAHCTYEHRSCNKFCEWISREAYDIDKVVEELYEERTEILLSNDYESEIINYCLYNFDRAIEIVKQGLKEQK